MTAKEYKYLNILKDYFAASGAEGWSKAMNAALGYDYQTAVLLWEYALTENESRLSRPEYADVYADATEALFEKKNASRFARTLLESQVIRNAVYRFSRTSLGRAETVVSREPARGGQDGRRRRDHQMRVAQYRRRQDVRTVSARRGRTYDNRTAQKGRRQIANAPQSVLIHSRTRRESERP